jgi:transposase-like protein
MFQTPELLSDPVYHDEEAARLYVQEIRWPDGVYCPFCGTLDGIKPLGGESMGPGWFYCTACQDKFTVRVGSVFERSHIPLHKWLLAFRLMASSKKGCSAHQLHRTLGITYKSAWFLGHRIRECMTDTDPAPLGGKDKVIEADETYFGRTGDPKDSVFVTGKGWVRRDGEDKMKVMTLVERGGKARSVHIDRATSAELNRVLVAKADPQSSLMTDDFAAYRLPAVALPAMRRSTIRPRNTFLTPKIQRQAISETPTRRGPGRPHKAEPRYPDIAFHLTEGDYEYLQ